MGEELVDEPGVLLVTESEREVVPVALAAVDEDVELATEPINLAPNTLACTTAAPIVDFK